MKNTQSSSGTVAKRTNLHALVVEADPTLQQLCRDILEDAGFSVDIAGSGIGALVIARDKRPDLILLNMQLPDVTAKEAAVWLRSNPELHATPIVVLKAGIGDHADFGAVGPIAFLRQPIAAPIIRTAIHQIFK